MHDPIRMTTARGLALHPLHDEEPIEAEWKIGARVERVQHTVCRLIAWVSRKRDQSYDVRHQHEFYHDAVAQRAPTHSQTTAIDMDDPRRNGSRKGKTCHENQAAGRVSAIEADGGTATEVPILSSVTHATFEPFENTFPECTQYTKCGCCGQKPQPWCP
jgi:hypothetical protein